MSWWLWQTPAMSLLALNAGSSSIRFALFEAGTPPLRVCGGKLDRIGHPEAALTVADSRSTAMQAPADLDGTSFPSAVDSLLKWMESQRWFRSVEAVGHRVVHGMRHTAPQRATHELLEELKHIDLLDPEHLPQEIELVETLMQKFPALPQALCFDTAFHRDLPLRSRLLPIPRRYAAAGIRRYGFHGLSYTYLMQELERLHDRAAGRGRVILAHLGSGASLAAVRDGRCIDTTMGLTPTGGLMMGTRCGDLDPGVLLYLLDGERMDAAALRRTLNHESGLLGISETSADVRDLLRREADDARAAEAIELFCYRVRTAIASFAGALGGVDTLVFAGGIGENSPEIRARICEGLEFLGITLDEARNVRSAGVISAGVGTGAAAVTVRVIRTDEESVIAQLAAGVLAIRSKGETP
ncbi:MAG TPA: acetate/propionate family kinase [Steroidobacteraceae bacterium]|nr:acetate/propionate family kinase [Steroidobacteraceae bacterium]